MPSQPEELHPALCNAFNAGDLDAVLALYDPEAVYVIKPGRVTRGRAELRAAMERNLALRGRLAITPLSFTPAGDVVLVLGSFTLAGQRRDGSAFERTARFADVLRRQGDGRWLLAIDNPFGDPA
jgi:uncharacterized protein (TIGR02246 family)